MVTKNISLICITAFVLSACAAPTAHAATGGGETDSNGQKTAIHFNETQACIDECIPLKLSLELTPQLAMASWYGEYFQGRLMANGRRFDMNKVSIAHRHWPLGARVRLQNPENGNEIVAVVTDRGNMGKYGRQIDLSKEAAKLLGIFRQGTGFVRVIHM